MKDSNETSAGFCQSAKTGGLLPPLYLDHTRNTAAEILQWVADIEYRISDTLLLTPAKPQLKIVWYAGSEHRANALRSWRETIEDLRAELARRKPSLFQ